MTTPETKPATKSNLKWWILVTVIIGTFLGRLDQTIVNLALPKIILDFGITLSAASWIGTAYILANAVFVPVWGKLGDKLGRKKIYLLGFSIFIFGSVLAGFAWNLSSMIVFRIIQAIAGSADYPTAMAIIAVTFREPKDRAQALGLWSVSFAAASVFGPLVGGPLIDMFGWRSVFLINLPVGVLGIIMALLFIDESKEESSNKTFDWWGSITLGIALCAIILILEKGLEWGWMSGMAIFLYLLSAMFLYLFYRIEVTHHDPIVDFKFFKIFVFTGTLVNNFLVFMALMGAMFTLPIFISNYMGYNATQTGYVFIPMAVFMVLGATLGGKTTGKIKSHHMIAFSTLMAGVGIYLFSVFLDPRSGIMDVIIPLSVMAFGMGLAMAHRTNAIASVVPEKEIGSASSVLALVRNIAGAFGIAIFATILQKSTENAIINLSKFSVVHATSPLQYGQAINLMILKAQMLGYSQVYILAAVILIVGSILALFVKPKHEKNITVHVE